MPPVVVCVCVSVCAVHCVQYPGDQSCWAFDCGRAVSVEHTDILSVNEEKMESACAESLRDYSPPPSLLFFPMLFFCFVILHTRCAEQLIVSKYQSMKYTHTRTRAHTHKILFIISSALNADFIPFD